MLLFLQTPALFFQYTGLNSAFVLSSSGVLTQNHIFSFKLQADRDAREKDKELTYALEKQRKYENVSSADYIIILFNNCQLQKKKNPPKSHIHTFNNPHFCGDFWKNIVK